MVSGEIGPAGGAPGLTAADGPQRFTALATAGGIIWVYWRMSRNPEPERRGSLVVGIAGLVDVIGAVAYVGTALLFIISASIFFSIRFAIPLACALICGAVTGSGVVAYAGAVSATFTVAVFAVVFVGGAFVLFVIISKSRAIDPSRGIPSYPVRVPGGAERSQDPSKTLQAL